ncbi:MAG: glycosyltransferase family A protein [Pseudomonadota bacterium]
MSEAGEAIDRAASERSPSLGVIVPAHQAESTLQEVLSALAAAGFAPDDILVVDDGSRDATASIANAAGLRVQTNEVAQGPSRARNAGAASLERDVLLFVDSDVVVHQDVRERVLGHFSGSSDLVAVFGSYDTRQERGGAISRYRNLLHHYVHQHSPAEAVTFWTGLGAVRRDAFLAQKGFDRAWENIEDVDLGLRLHADGGRIRLDHRMFGTHLKIWTIRSTFRTDLYGRALPWSRIVLFRGLPPGQLNTSLVHKVSLAAVAAMLGGVFMAPIAAQFLWISVLAALAFLIVNAPLLAFMMRQGGPVFGLKSVPCHILHYLAGGLGFAWVLAREYVPSRLGARGSGTPLRQ